MKTLFLLLENACRTLLILGEATWHRTPARRFRTLTWLRRYIQWSSVMIAVSVVFPSRGALFNALYGWFRMVDDILDGESAHPPDNILTYLREKGRLIGLFRNGTLRMEDVSGHDRLLVIILMCSARIGLSEEARRYIPIMWERMAEDYRWKKEQVIPSAVELSSFAKSQDEAIFRLAALTLGANPLILDRTELCVTGVLSRSDWLSDLFFDLSTGLVHLSKEGCGEFDLDYEFLTKGSDGALIHPGLTSVVIKEIKALNVLWESVLEQKELVLSAFSVSWVGRFYWRAMIANIRTDYVRACKRLTR